MTKGWAVRADGRQVPVIGFRDGGKAREHAGEHFLRRAAGRPSGLSTAFRPFPPKRRGRLESRVFYDEARRRVLRDF